MPHRRLELPLLLLAASLLTLPNLDRALLWQDEAQTALLATTVVEHGIPCGYDGRNHFSQELGAEYGEGYVWRWHTWLPFYVVALSFQVLGRDTVAARLPFALFGIGSVALSYLFARGLWRDRRAAISSSVMLLTCVPFLLLSRQARYYSAAAFFSLLGLEAYRRMLEGRRPAAAGFVVAATLLFHTHYVYCGALLASVALHAAAFRRTHRRRTLLACGAVLLLCLPWIAWLAGGRYGERYGATLFSPGAAMGPLAAYAGQLLDHVFPPFLLAVVALLAIVGVTRRRSRIEKSPVSCQAVALPVLFVASTVAALALTAPAPFFRYLAPVIPPLLSLAGLVASTAHRRLHPLAGAGVLLAFLWVQPSRDYLYELTHDYEGPIEGIVEFLDEHAEPADIVAITYGDLPLKFYTDLRIVGGLTGEDLTPARSARWVILRHHTISRKDLAVREYLQRNLPLHRFRPITLDVPDIPFENRESPQEHQYRTVEDAPRVVVLERVAP